MGASKIAAEAVLEKLVRNSGNVCRVEEAVIALRKAGFYSADIDVVKKLAPGIDFAVAEGHIYALYAPAK